MARPREGTEPLPLERQGLWMALCMGISPHPQPFGELKGLPFACDPLNWAMMSTISLTCCVVALRPKVSTVFDCAHQNLKLFKNLNIFRASNDIQPVGGAVAWYPSLLKH